MEINVELLLGTKVRDIDGEEVGRIEEFRVERDDKIMLGGGLLDRRIRRDPTLIGLDARPANRAPSEHSQDLHGLSHTVAGHGPERSGSPSSADSEARPPAREVKRTR